MQYRRQNLKMNNQRGFLVKKMLSIVLITIFFPLFTFALNQKKCELSKNKLARRPFNPSVWEEKTFKESQGVYNRGEFQTTTSIDLIGCEIGQRQDDYDRAILDLTKAIRLDPKNPDLYKKRGNAWSVKCYYDRAILDYTTAIKLNPKDVSSYFYRGFSWYEKGEYDRAISDYSNAIKLSPKYTLAYNDRGNAWAEKDEYDKAISDYNKAIKLDPKYPGAYCNRGDAWRMKGYYDRAILDCTKAIQLDSTLAEAYFNRAWAWREKGKYDKAIADYSKAIQLDPKDSLAYRNRGWNYFFIGKKNRALKDLNKAAKLNPGDLYTVIWLAGLGGDSSYLKSFSKEIKWSGYLARYILGSITRKQLLYQAKKVPKKKKCKEQLCEAYCYIALMYEGEKNLKFAKEYYQKCLDTNVKDFMEYSWAKARLLQLKRK